MVRYGAWREDPFPDPGELRPRAARRATPPPAHCPPLRAWVWLSAGLI